MKHQEAKGVGGRFRRTPETAEERKPPQSGFCFLCVHKRAAGQTERPLNSWDHSISQEISLGILHSNQRTFPTFPRNVSVRGNGTAPGSVREGARASESPGALTPKERPHPGNAAELRTLIPQRRCPGQRTLLSQEDWLPVPSATGHRSPPPRQCLSFPLR